MIFIKKYKLVFIGAILGMIGGYFYFQFYGCNGTCTITSKPLNSIMYGGLLGSLTVDIFRKKEK